MNGDLGNTITFTPMEQSGNDAQSILRRVYAALQEKGYNPVSQIVGYIVSEDPTYITSHNDARRLISQIDRDALLSEMIEYFIDK